jgi:hypothetical protein
MATTGSRYSGRLAQRWGAWRALPLGRWQSEQISGTGDRQLVNGWGAINGWSAQTHKTHATAAEAPLPNRMPVPINARWRRRMMTYSQNRRERAAS